MLEAFFQNSTQQKVAKYEQIVQKINALEPSLQALTDEQLKKQTTQLRNALQTSSGLEEQILIKSFALVREASVRTLGLRHFDVQLIGGLILNEGKIAEMQTGEGKTLVALLPSFFNALYKKKS